MKQELNKKHIHINFIQTTLLSGLTGIVTNQLKGLILTAIKDKTGQFLKRQFRQRATNILKEWLVKQLQGKFLDYLIDFIVTYIEGHAGEIFSNKIISKIAQTTIDNIITGLGTYLINDT